MTVKPIIVGTLRRNPKTQKMRLEEIETQRRIMTVCIPNVGFSRYFAIKTDIIRYHFVAKIDNIETLLKKVQMHIIGVLNLLTVLYLVSML